MQCPSCGGSIPPGRQSCPFCGWRFADERTMALPDEPGWDQSTEPEVPGPPREATRVLGDPERDKETRIVQPPPPPALPQRGSVGGGGDSSEAILSEDFDRALAVVRSIYRRLHAAERVSVWTTMAAFLGAFSPWYYRPGYGLQSGVQTWPGIGVALALGVSLLVLYLRFSKRWSLWAALLQFLLVAAAAVGSVYLALVPGAGMRIVAGLPATAMLSATGAVSEFVGILARA